MSAVSLLVLSLWVADPSGEASGWATFPPASAPGAAPASAPTPSATSSGSANTASSVGASTQGTGANAGATPASSSNAGTASAGSSATGSAPSASAAGIASTGSAPSAPAAGVASSGSAPSAPAADPARTGATQSASAAGIASIGSAPSAAASGVANAGAPAAGVETTGSTLAPTSASRGAVPAASASASGVVSAASGGTVSAAGSGSGQTVASAGGRSGPSVGGPPAPSARPSVGGPVAPSESLPGISGTPVRVENRILVKEGRFFATGGFSYLFRGDYYLSPAISGTGSYFLNEGHGLEAKLDVFVSFLAPGAAEVFNATGLIPDSHRPVARLSAGYRNAIAYGKVMAFNAFLLHFDLHAFAHMGFLFTDRGVAPALDLGPGFLVKVSPTLYLQFDLPVSVSFEARQSGLVTVGVIPSITLGIRP